MKFLLAAAFALLADAFPPVDVTKWQQLNSEGIRLVESGNYAAAEARFRAALLEAEPMGGADYRLRATLSNLAYSLQEQSDLGGAEKLYRRVLQLREEFLPPDSPEIASALNNLASVLHSAARDEQADPLARRAIQIAEDAHKAGILAASLNTLGLALMGQGEDARAEPVLRRALAMFEEIGGPDSLDVGKTANNLASVYSHQDEFIKAELQLRRALPIYEQHLPAGHPLIAAVLNNLFVVLGAQKRFDEAAPYLRRALDISERSAPEGLRTQQMRANLASLESSQGHWQSAADLLKRAVDAEQRLLGPDHPSVALALANYAEALKHLNHKAEARDIERKANNLLKSYRHGND